MKAEYTNQCIQQRRAGQPESTFAEFEKRVAAQSWPKRFKRFSHNFAILNLQRANFSLTRKRWGSAVTRLVFASLADPQYVIASVKRRLQSKN